MNIDIEKEWKRLWDALEDSSVSLNEFLSGSLPISTQKSLKKFIKSFDAMKPIAERLDSAIITPIEPLAVELPWQEVEFAALWAYWKDYRLEKFHAVYVSREEIKALEHLKKISKDDCERAKEVLNVAMARGYYTFYPTEDNKKFQPELNTNEDGDKPFN